MRVWREDDHKGYPMAEWNREELQAIEEALLERYAGEISSPERLSVLGWSSNNEVRAVFVLEGNPSGERVEYEAKVDINKSKTSVESARYLVLDALDLMLLEYLESERGIRYSGVFEERDLSGKTVSIRAERTYPALDAQADEWLKTID
jgi:hypothetical protein